MSFTELTREIAARFLQTVVVFDDEAYLQAPDDPPPDDAVLVAPGPRGEHPTPIESADEVRPPSKNQQLDAKVLMDSFAKRGQVCAVLAPAKHEDLVGTVVDCGRKADVLVLDWQIGKDNGDTAVRVVNRVLAEDLKQGGRLRLVVIYTGEPQLASCCTTVLEQVKGLSLLSDGRFVLVKENFRVVFIRKTDGATVPGDATSERDLPERIIREFAEFAGGLLPNAAMSAAAAVRENVHVLLRRFGKELDGAYLGHRMLLPQPEDAESFLFELVGDEIKSLFDLPLLADHVVGIASLKDYLAECHGNSQLVLKQSRDSDKKLSPPISIDRVIKVVEGGPKAIDPNWQWGGKSHLHERLHPLFHATITDGERWYAAFARLSSFRREAFTGHLPDDFEPMLSLGTILKDPAGRYLICLQPVCDCVRLDCNVPRNFLFGEFDRSEKPFDLVVRDETGDVRLRFALSPYRVFPIAFNPGNRAGIVARRVGGLFSFESADTVQYGWIGDLRRLVAQRFACRFSEQISRIGLDEFEWQRLHARKIDT